jgi:FlaA1/EpsC-like NDP-sugar epimerase
VGITKLLTEYYLQQKDAAQTRLMTLRLPNVPDSPASVTLIFKKQIENNQEITITDPEMSRVFVSLDEAGVFLQHILQNGKNKDTFVVTKKPTKITDLAQKMIQDSGKEIAIKYIGIQAGEKLEEEPYPKEFIEETVVNGLSLYNREGQDTKEIIQSLSILQSKLSGGKAGLKTIKQIEKVLSLK